MFFKKKRSCWINDRFFVVHLSTKNSPLILNYNEYTEKIFQTKFSRSIITKYGIDYTNRLGAGN